jgi:uncharacterized membrane protein
MLANSETHGPGIGGWEVARNVSEWIEIGAILVIAVTVAVAVARTARTVINRDWNSASDVFKRAFSRGVLIGLDLLIAADIIRTVTLEPTLANVAALGLLIFIRTFLAWALVLEAEGRWPWQTPCGDPTVS